MTNFDRFRNKNLNQIVSEKKFNSRFIVEGYPSIEINLETREQPTTQQACVVNKQEKDMAYVYTFNDEPLEIGDIFTAKSLRFLVTEEIVIIKDVDFRKYYALLCNADLGDDNWGYFRGPEKSYINTVTKEDSTAFSQQKPILVARQGYFNIHDTISVNGRPWLIIEADTISSPIIGYYSLKPTTASKNAADTIILPSDSEADENDILQVSSLDRITVSTEDGYFTTLRKLQNVNITSSEVSFTVPFGIDEITVSVKENGEIVNKTYKVV